MQADGLDRDAEMTDKPAGFGDCRGMVDVVSEGWSVDVLQEEGDASGVVAPVMQVVQGAASERGSSVACVVVAMPGGSGADVGRPPGDELVGDTADLQGIRSASSAGDSALLMAGKSADGGGGNGETRYMEASSTMGWTAPSETTGRLGCD